MIRIQVSVMIIMTTAKSEFKRFESIYVCVQSMFTIHINEGVHMGERGVHEVASLKYC